MQLKSNYHFPIQNKNSKYRQCDHFVRMFGISFNIVDAALFRFSHGHPVSDPFAEHIHSWLRVRSTLRVCECVCDELWTVSSRARFNTYVYIYIWYKVCTCARMRRMCDVRHRNRLMLILPQFQPFYEEIIIHSAGSRTHTRPVALLPYPPRNERVLMHLYHTTS